MKPNQSSHDQDSAANPADLTPLGTALASYLEESGLGESLSRLGALDEWPEAVGSRVAKVTRAVEVKGDTLVVEVLSSPWMNELAMMSRLILEGVNTHRDGPAVNRIRFRLAEKLKTD